MVRFVMYWALAGVLIPVAILILSFIEQWTRIFMWWLDSVAIVLWPSWIFLAATDGQEFTAFGLLVLTISIAVNVILYSAVGTLVWFLWSLYDRYFK